MSIGIGDILKGRKLNQPDEIQKIKDFILREFKSSASVDLTPKSIIIGVNSSALAGALRMQLHELQNQLKTDKKLVIRIQ